MARSLTRTARALARRLGLPTPAPSLPGREGVRPAAGAAAAPALPGSAAPDGARTGTADGTDGVLVDLTDLVAASGDPQAATAVALRTRGTDVVAAVHRVADRDPDPRWQVAAAVARAAVVTPPDLSAADPLLAVHAEHGDEPFTARDQLVLAHCLYLSGRLDALEDVLPRLGRLAAADVHHLRTDLLARRGGDRDTWLALFRTTWREAGLLEPTLTPGTEHAFDGLGTDAGALAAARDGVPGRLAGAGVTAGLPLVSVVVSAYRPDEGLRTAVRSLLEQTWPAVEVLVVDDASGPEHATLFAEVGADPRVRVLHQERNGGSYVARNRGLVEARGSLVTFHDADDWAHPQRLERQALPLLRDPAVPGTHSLAMRALDDLDRTWFGYPAVRTNASSLMVRRAVLAEVGPYDPVRKSADMEFTGRLERLSGARVVLVPEVLAVTRLRARSLSRGDFSLGWATAGRIAYQNGYRTWHATLGPDDAGAVPDLAVATREGDRPFAAPRSFLARREEWQDPPPGRSVLVVADACVRDLPHGPGLAELLEALASDGARVQLLHQEDATRLRPTRARTHSSVQRLLDTGRVLQVHPEEPVRADVACVASVATVLLERDDPRELAVDRFVVLDPPGGLSPLQQQRLRSRLGRWCEAPVHHTPVRPTAAELVATLSERSSR